jgi:ankyrin repeat protein
MNLRMNAKTLLMGTFVLLAAATAFAAGKQWPPAIFQALQDDNPAPLRSLIGNGFIIDTQDETTGETVLMMGASQSKLKIIKFLVNEGANVDLQDKNGSTALHRAAKENTEALKLLLLAKPNLKLVTKQGLSAVETAALFGKRDALNLLITAGATYESDLVFASALGDVAAIKDQIAKGCDVNIANKSGFVPLVAAARTGQIEAVRELLGKGAKPDGAGSTTPLIMAVGWHQEQVAATLLDSHANPNLADVGGLTPLVNAIQVRDSQEVNLLLEKGAKVSAVGTTYSPIHEAARADDLNILQALVKQGADINALFSAEGFTPLMIAASENKPRATQFLLMQGARVGLKAKVIIAHGGYTDGPHKEEEQMTALQMAEQNRLETIIEIFQNPEGFKLADLERDYTNSKDVSVADWQKKYTAAFKKTFGEPTKVVDIDETSFWYYQCADGLIELKLANPKFAGSQLAIEGLSTVAEPKSGDSRTGAPTISTKDETAVGNSTAPSNAQKATANKESQVQPQEIKPQKEQLPVESTPPASQQENTQARQNEELAKLSELTPEAKGGLSKAFLNIAKSSALPRMVDTFLEEGVDVNTADPAGNTALMFATQSGHFQVVTFLIEKGADIDKTNQMGKTALDLAQDEQIITALKKAQYAKKLKQDSGVHLPNI